MKQNHVSDFQDDYFYNTFWIFLSKRKKKYWKKATFTDCGFVQDLWHLPDIWHNIQDLVLFLVKIVPLINSPTFVPSNGKEEKYDSWWGKMYPFTQYWDIYNTKISVCLYWWNRKTKMWRSLAKFIVFNSIVCKQCVQVDHIRHHSIGWCTPR